MASSLGPKSQAEDVAARYAPQIRNKVILTTGVSPGGLGAYFVETIAAHEPKLLILAGRDLSKTQQTSDAIKRTHPHVQTRNLKLDLADLSQIREAANEVNAYPENINVLVNNAAVMACPYATTKDGLEMQLGAGHFGHFHFTTLVLEKVLASEPGARIVNVSSDGHRLSPVRWEDWDFSKGKTYNKWQAYGQTKTANMLFSVALVEKYGGRGLQSFSLHPGVIQTNLGRYLEQEDLANLRALDKELGNYEANREGLPMKSLSEGTSTHVFASFDPDIAEENNGGYCIDCRLARPNEIRCRAADKSEAVKLWKLSEEVLGERSN